MAALCKVATTHDSGAALDALLLRPGWQTLAAIAREHAPRPSATASGAAEAPKTREADETKFTYDGLDSDDDMAFDDANDEFIPDDDDDDDVQPGSSSGPGGGDTDAPEDAKVCPHCTFHNPLGVADCEVCGLPI